MTNGSREAYKTTYSCLIKLAFVDMGKTEQVRVTFEAENNLDFRLGTGPLRHTKLAKQYDLAALTRVSEDEYELRIIKKGKALYGPLAAYAVTFVGHQGKRYGFLPNAEFYEIIGARKAATLHS